MSEYLTVLKQSMKESIKLARELQNNNALYFENFQELKKYIQECNQKIFKEFISDYPHSSSVEIIQFYLENYSYRRLKCERKLGTGINVIFEDKILDFSTLMVHYSSLFSYSADLNALLFRMILVLNLCREYKKELIDISPKKYELEKYGISRNETCYLLRKYLYEISNGDVDFTRKYGRKSNLDLIYKQIIRTMSEATYMKLCRNRSTYKNIPIKNIIALLMDAIVTEQEMVSSASRTINRHPAWCYYNMIGNGKCIEFNRECHSTIGCPFFKKAIRLASGAIKIDE